MIYTAIDAFYLTDKELENSPSRKDGIDEATEINLRIYGCDLIQESGILLRLPQAVMASGQVLFHRFYCKKSFAKFNVKSLAASCVWVASKLEESPRKARHVIHVFHRREKLPIEYLELFSTKYTELKSKLIKMERHLLKEMGFVCHVEHPHKFISNYLATLETPPELRQEAWNLANDSLRATLCVRFKSEVVACGVVYAAARRFQVPLPENPPWWIAFDADKSGIDEVCRVLAHLYSLPKAQYINVCEEKGSLTTTSRSWDPPSQPISKEGALTGPPINDDLKPATPTLSMDSGGSKDSLVEAAIGKVNESKKDDDIPQSMHLVEGEVKEDQMPRKPKSERKLEAGRERNKDREREREKDRVKVRDRDRGRESDRERERKDAEREREEKIKDRTHRSKDKGRDSGNSDKLKHHSSRGRGYSSREKDRHRHHSYG